MHEGRHLYDLIMKVELRHLRCLVAIAEAGSFTDAAIDLGISQAAASRTLASLEAALGVRLLRRTTREVTLTAVGGRVLAHAAADRGEGDFPGGAAEQPDAERRFERRQRA